METTHLTKVRQTTIGDRLAVCHGRYVERDTGECETFRFSRDEISFSLSL
ncbi:DUF3388 domain-containing protein [Sporolactobacillus kofuensis]|uniref:DUF3388 domain-containing protein n=1 Tax=Sporolactobacillus kofuensis TaxID=269672 RepID=A0ABW1WBC9_9BACL